MNTTMRLGIDFDNTIVCYDQVFHQVALERKIIPPELPMYKNAIRNYLRMLGKEEGWTELQGYVYGERMAAALPFPGVIECFAICLRQGIPLYIISHKTRRPYRGPAYDLHQTARDWLKSQGFFDTDRVGLSPQHVFFEISQEQKLQRIAGVGCTHFLDDLPEFLENPGFPKHVKRLLFDPNESHRTESRFARITSWMEFEQYVCRKTKAS